MPALTFFLRQSLRLRFVRGKENRKEQKVYKLGEENGEEGSNLALIVFDMDSLRSGNALPNPFHPLFSLPNDHRPQNPSTNALTPPSLHLSLLPKKL